MYFSADKSSNNGISEVSDKPESSPAKSFSPKPQLTVLPQITSPCVSQQVNPTAKRKWGKK